MRRAHTRMVYTTHTHSRNKFALYKPTGRREMDVRQWLEEKKLYGHRTECMDVRLWQETGLSALSRRTWINPNHQLTRTDVERRKSARVSSCISPAAKGTTPSDRRYTCNCRTVDRPDFRRIETFATCTYPENVITKINTPVQHATTRTEREEI
jgi:hypothetical protein